MKIRNVRRAAAVGGLAVVTSLLPFLPAQAAVPGPMVGWATSHPRQFILASSDTFAVSTSEMSDAATGGKPTSVQVRISKTPLTSTTRKAWTYPSHLQHLGLLSSGNTGKFTVGIAQGQASCVQARAYDAAGRAGAWGSVDCIARFIGDASLEHAGKVRTVRAKRFWGGTASEIDGGGQLVLRHVPKNSQVWVLGRPAPLGSTADWGTTPRTIGMNATGTKQIVLGENGGITIGRHMWQTTYNTKHLGSVWLRPDEDNTFPIEGLVVLPPWVTSRS